MTHRRWMCRFGLHNWRGWAVRFSQIQQERRCASCGLWQRRPL